MNHMLVEDKIEGLNQTPEDQTLAKLREAFLQCFWDGKLDIDQLLTLCG